MAEQKPEPVKKTGKKIGCLGCSFSLGVFIVIIVFLVLIIVSIAIGPIGNSIFKFNLPSWLKVPAPHVLLPAEPIFDIGPFVVTNSIITSWLTMVLLIVIMGLVMGRSKIIPGRFQSIIESAFDWLYNFCKEVAGPDNGRRFFPIITTIIVFVLFNGWLSLLPGFGSFTKTEDVFDVPGTAQIQDVNTERGLKLDTKPVTIEGLISQLNNNKPPTANQKFAEGNVKFVVLSVQGGKATNVEVAPQVPVLRGANTDINTPLALAIISFVFVEFMGISTLGIKYFKKFVNVGRFFRGWGKLFRGKVKSAFGDLFFGFVDAAVGGIEALSEVFRLISLTFRLFGNMIGGEILVFIFFFLMFVTPIIIPYGLEILFGLIQALIFGFLTLVFATIATTSSHEGEGH